MAFSLQNLRFRCAISWIQSFYDDVTFPFPREVLSYPYTDLYTSNIRSELISWLTRGVPYFRLISHILSLPYNHMTSFEDTINRIPYGDIELDAVSLASSDPFVMEQHLSLVESVMKMYYSTFLSVDSVSRQLQKLSGIDQSFTSIEDGLLAWLRLVCEILRRRDKISVPELLNLSTCLSNGCLLLLLLHFYIPHCIQLSNGKFSQELGLEDAFHNATLVSNACAQMPQLKFCLSPQGIVRSSDTVMLPYVTVSLTSLFICFELSDPGAIYRPPALYGALIGQPFPGPKLRESARFHSMDSVARVATHSRDSLVTRDLITPSAENLIANMVNSNTTARYPRSFRSPAQTVKSSSTPELSRGTGIFRHHNVLKISSREDEFPRSATIERIPEPDPVVREVFPELIEPKDAWSPLKQSDKGAKSDTSSSEVSLDSRESLSARIESEPNDRNVTPPRKPEVIRLNIFPVAKESPPRDPLSLLLRMEANRLRADQSEERTPSTEFDAIKLQLGQLAFSYLTTNQKMSFEQFLQSKLNPITNHECNETDSNTIPNNIHGPLETVDTPVLVEESKNTQIDLTPSDKSGEPLTFYVVGSGAGAPSDDVTGGKSPFATERARNMLRMLENRSSERKVSKQISQKPTVPTPPPEVRPEPAKPISPAVSLQSVHSNATAVLPGNATHRFARAKRFGSANDVTTHPVPKHKSNKQIIKNAICDVCLAGGPNTAKKVEVLRSLADCQSDHFLILFRDIIGCKFRGLYAYDHVGETGRRIGGAGPHVLTQEIVVKLYKYNSGAKEFQEIPARRVSYSTDGVTILDNLWGGRRKQ